MKKAARGHGEGVDLFQREPNIEVGFSVSEGAKDLPCYLVFKVKMFFCYALFRSTLFCDNFF